EKTNAFTVVNFILELLKENMLEENEICELEYLLNLENTDPKIVENEMKLELASKEKDFFHKIEFINKLKTSYEEKKEIRQIIKKIHYIK
ncbi:MAG: hypothetical protein LBC39_06840, partial [Methanobrevibacter sp.]|nr:hypothetical protein [Candidatus Methanovirga aequatorialis]